MNIILRRNPTRALTTFHPFYQPVDLLDEVEGLAREFWGAWRPVVSVETLVPHMEMYEDKGELVVKAELPGIKKEDLEVNLEGDVLTIKAEKKEEEVAEDTTYHARERYYGQYYRSTQLPFHVDGDKISATFENGLLEIRLPRAEEAKARRIEVKAQLPQAEHKKVMRRRKQKAS